MNDFCGLIWCGVVGLFRSRSALQAEILVLRHQLNVLRRRSPKRVVLGNIDRLVFAALYRLAPEALDSLKILKPETVIRWHRAGFRAYWRWKSRPYGGRPRKAADIRQLIYEMSVAIPLWGAPRIHASQLVSVMTPPSPASPRQQTRVPFVSALDSVTVSDVLPVTYRRGLYPKQRIAVSSHSSVTSLQIVAPVFAAAGRSPPPDPEMVRVQENGGKAPMHLCRQQDALESHQRHPGTLAGFSRSIPVPQEASTNDSRDSFKFRCKLHGVYFVHIDFALVMTAWMKPDAESIMSRPCRFYLAIFFIIGRL